MIDILIISAYLILTLVIGIYKGRGITTMRDFAIADYKYTTPIIVATIVATAVGGGSTLGIAEKVFSVGIVYILIFFGEPINNLLTALFIAPRMAPYKGMISVGDIMYSLYGKWGRLITGISGILLCIGYVGAQVSALGYVCHFFLNIPHLWGIILSCGIVILYSTFGGIRAVTATDVFQFGVLIIAIPMICNVGLNLIGGYGTLFHLTPPDHLTLFPPDTLKYFLLFIIFSIPFLNPAVTQRLLMAKDTKQAVDSMRISALIGVPFFLIAGLNGLIALVLNPQLDSHLALPYLINTILPEGLKGAAISGMLAVIMSTADSYLNVASVVLVHDLIKPSLGKHLLTDQKELMLTRVATFILGTLAIIAAVSFKSIIDIVVAAFNFWSPTVLTPLLAGIFGIKASTRSFLRGVSAGLITFILWNLYIGEIWGLDSLVPGTLMNAGTFFFSHFLEKKYRPIYSAPSAVKN